MGNLINSLRQLIREEIALEASNQGRLGKGLMIADPEKAAKLKKLYPEDHWVHKIITTIENAGDKDVTRLGYTNPSTGEFVDGLKQILNMKSERVNPEIRELIANGILADKSETAIPKKQKPESTGQRGRKTSDKSREGIIRALFANFQENPDYEPSEEELTYNLPKGLGTEKLDTDLFNKVKSRALGLTKRGRPAQSSDDPLLSKVKKELSGESLHEIYKKLKKIK